MNAPLDTTHQDSMTATAAIRQYVAGLREGVARWTPRPCPPR